MAKEISSLIVNQWLKEWDQVPFSIKNHRKKPEPCFYMFSMPAKELKALSGIQRRTLQKSQLRSDDLGIQRRHDQSRSTEIAKFAKYGYPWSELSDAKKKSGEYDSLRKPGWLPTAIVINILKAEDDRYGKEVDSKDQIQLKKIDANFAKISLPQSFSGKDWQPKGLHPIEVIDGQHRLWAFEEKLSDGDYDLPVVAFYGLDISWQAYLFWTINIKPKRINASLAFDLYPLLRAEDWLEKFDGHSIYRESRAQELTEALWSHPESPWYQRINMLGETGLEQPMVSQAAWVRSLTSTYVKNWEGRRLGGLFGAKLGTHKEVLKWSRAQQAAFLIFTWQELRTSVKKSTKKWATELRKNSQLELFDNNKLDKAFASSSSLLSTDQGVRAVLSVTNDLCYIKADELKLDKWTTDDQAVATDEDAVTNALKSLPKQPAAVFIKEIVERLAEFDWRTSSAPGLTKDDQAQKSAYRGSGGYKLLRFQLLRSISLGTSTASKAAKLALDI